MKKLLLMGLLAVVFTANVYGLKIKATNGAKPVYLYCEGYPKKLIGEIPAKSANTEQIIELKDCPKGKYVYYYYSKSTTATSAGKSKSNIQSVAVNDSSGDIIVYLTDGGVNRLSRQ